jgi:hypothetical protein
MTTKFIQLEVQIPDEHEPITSETLVEMISNELQVMCEQFKLPPITEIKVTKTIQE